MLPFFTDVYANPASAHALGQQAAEAIREARAHVANLIGASPGEIVFTSGATESNNLAIMGLARALESRTTRRRIVTTPTEHKAVLDPCQALGKMGFDVVLLPVDANGTVILGEAASLIDDNTLLVSVHAANNEIGTIQPVRALAELSHKAGAVFHTDAVQAVGKIPVDVNEWEVDMLSLSAHKLYGPKGVGALYLHGGPRGVPLTPLLLGGGQEQALRPGTLNMPGIVGFGRACALAAQQMTEEAERIAALRDQFETLLMNALDVKRNGNLKHRLANNSSLTFTGIDAEAIMVHTPELMLSTGSACTSGALEPSHVLQAIGLSRAAAYSTLRIGLGRFTTPQDTERAARLLVDVTQKLLSPGDVNQAVP